jgi:ankyrin repeat protein
VAIEQGNTKRFKAICDQILAVYLASYNGAVPFERAASEGILEILPMIIKMYSTEIAKYQGPAVLQTEDEFEDVFENTIEAEIESPFAQVLPFVLWKGLYLASKNGHVKVVHFLLEKGAGNMVSVTDYTLPLNMIWVRN